MRTFLLVVVAALTTQACGGGKPGPVDAGRQIDASCGLDCEAQAHYGLHVGRCVEYSQTPSASSPPSLGVMVLPVATLEDGVKVLPVEYRQGGQARMTDSFAILPSGELRLIRRQLAGGESVSYQDDAGVLHGVTWLGLSTPVEVTNTTTVMADVIGRPGGRVKEETKVAVSTLAPTNSDLTTPQGAFDGGLTLLYSETPSHAADSRRTFVPGEGFVLISTSLQFGGTAIPYRQQKAHATDGGFFDCSLGGAP